MAAIYPYRWLGQFADIAAMTVARDEWLKALQGFEESSIERGLAHLRIKGGQFPPNIPEFVKMCIPKPEEFGIIDEERAYQAFLAKDFSNPVVFATQKALQPREFEMRIMWTRDHKKEFLKMYKICSEDHIKQQSENKTLSISDNNSDTKRLSI